MGHNNKRREAFFLRKVWRFVYAKLKREGGASYKYRDCVIEHVIV